MNDEDIIIHEENEELDAKWITEFDNTDKLYESFYADDLYDINIHFVYVNKSNEIENIRNEIFYMSEPNYVTRNEVLGLLKRNSTCNKIPYNILSILKFNITLAPENITSFLQNDSPHIVEEYLTTIKNIDAIPFIKTINMFHDINDLYFIFYEKNLVKERNSNSVTKRVFIHSKNGHKKTIKKTA